MAAAPHPVNQTQPTMGSNMKRVLATLFGAALLVSGFGAVSANADPGPDNGNSKKGLCTAYFNGQKNGHDDNSPPPFLALEDAADEQDGEDGADSGDAFEVAADVFDFCEGLIGGNPTNGRFDCSTTEEDGTTCEDGGGPGAEGKGRNE